MEICERIMMTWAGAKKIRIALLDDHAVVRHGLVACLREEEDFEVVGAYANSRELISALGSLFVDILLIDYSLSADDNDGLNLIRALKVRFPGSNIIVSSAHYNPATVALTMRAGALGFFGKEQALPELIAAVRSVSVGRMHLDPLMEAEISAMLSSDQSNSNSLINSTELSPREREVLRCCLEGMSVTQIAEKFMRSVKTISGQKRTAFRKLGVHNDNEFFKIQHQC